MVPWFGDLGILCIASPGVGSAGGGSFIPCGWPLIALCGVFLFLVVWIACNDFNRFHGLLLAFLIELIEDNQSYLKHRHLENNESHHQSNHIRQFQDAAKGRLQDNR